MSYHEDALKHGSFGSKPSGSMCRLRYHGLSVRLTFKQLCSTMLSYKVQPVLLSYSRSAGFCVCLHVHTSSFLLVCSAMVIFWQVKLFWLTSLYISCLKRPRGPCGFASTDSRISITKFETRRHGSNPGISREKPGNEPETWRCFWSRFAIAVAWEYDELSRKMLTASFLATICNLARISIPMKKVLDFSNISAKRSKLAPACSLQAIRIEVFASSRLRYYAC